MEIITLMRVPTKIAKQSVCVCNTVFCSLAVVAHEKKNIFMNFSDHGGAIEPLTARGVPADHSAST